jgi:hypothetical protein
MKNPAAVVLLMRKLQYQTNNHTSCRNTISVVGFKKKKNNRQRSMANHDSQTL